MMDGTGFFLRPSGYKRELPSLTCLNGPCYEIKE